MGQRIFLVTNWHNVTGKDRETGKHISETLCEPNNLIIWFPGSEPGNWKGYPVCLFLPDGRPRWIEHPGPDQDVDLVCVEVHIPEGVMVNIANEIEHTPMVPEIGTDLFVIGYPFKLDTIGLPVWKRASLASEIEMDKYTGPNRFLIDTATRKGMSGSLVIRKATGSFETGDDMFVISQDQPAYCLMGIYAGRLGANKDGDAQLGIVWPRSFVEELLEHAITL